MALSLYATNNIQDHLHSVASFTMPVAGYWALFQTNPCPGSADGLTPSGVEATYTGYTRMPAVFGASVLGVSLNSGTITFPVSTSVNGTMKYVGLMDALTAGKLIEGFSIPAEPINNGTQVIFAVGNLSSTASG